MIIVNGLGSRYAAIRALSVLVTPPATEPITRAQAKLRAGLDWADGDPRDALMDDFIQAARAKVEADTGLALITQTRDVYFDRLPDPIEFPAQSHPLQSVTSVTWTDADGVAHVLDPDDYAVDAVAGRVAFLTGGAWPGDLRIVRPWVVRIVAGYATAAAVPPSLRHAVGLLASHYMTVGRDLTTVGTIITSTPYGYDDAIAAFVPVGL